MSTESQSSQPGISDERMLARKAYIVRLVQSIPQLEGFDELVDDYWDDYGDDTGHVGTWPRVLG